MERRILPIGIQTFEKLRNTNCVYVDKTQYVCKLAQTAGYYFLSRPRRFGKSLLLSTMDAYFSGKKQLFTGLAIENLEKDWINYPVFYFDFNGQNYTDVNAVKEILNYTLTLLEKLYGCDNRVIIKSCGLPEEA